LLTGCPRPPPETITISGVVSDDVVVGATVQVKSLTTGTQLATATTDSAGAYTATVPATVRSEGLSLSASGGKMRGEPFIGTMTALYAPAQSFAGQANITLLTTAVEKAATSSAAGSTLGERLGNTVEQAVSRGVLPTDYSAVAPSGSTLQYLQGQAARYGIAGSTDSYSRVVAAPPATNGAPSGCSPLGSDGQRCWSLIGASGGQVSDPNGAAVVFIPAGHFTEAAGASGCAWKVVAVVASHSVNAWLEHQSVAGIAKPGCGPSSTTNITLTLPPAVGSATPGLLQCAAKTHTLMPECVTVGAGIAPRYHMTVNEVFSYLGGDPSAARSANVSSINPAEALAGFTHLGRLDRSYATQLYSSYRASAGSALGQWANKTAVIFVHGFTLAILGPTFGGSNDTWGQLPVNVYTLPPSPDGTAFAPLNFQWSTDGSFIDAAADLAKAVDYAFLSTGKKVHIVAHSFGGVLARVLLQDVPDRTRAPGSTWASSAAKVASLTTVGTPHSGIAVDLATSGPFAGRKLVAVEQPVYLPQGWQPLGFPLDASGKLCRQLTCYQAGLSNALIAPFAIADVQGQSASASNLPPGYVAARLFTTRNSLPQQLKILALIGQTLDLSHQNFLDGDGLISYAGQRFLPSQFPNVNGTATIDPLLRRAAIGGATVTERLLGLDGGVNGYPAQSVAGLNLQDGFGSVFGLGYEHINVPLFFDAGYTPEVNVDPNCTISDCKHSTWVNLKAFLLSQHGGPASDNFPANITSATCSAAVAGQDVTCTVTGADIPATNFLLATNCAPAAMLVAPTGNPSNRKFTCTAGLAGSAISFSYQAVDPNNQLGSFRSPLPPIAPLTITVVPATPIVTGIACGPPVANQAMTCTVTGSGLPESGISLTATNCTPSVMTPQPGGSASSRTFSCVPVAPGPLTISGILIPGYSGTPVLPTYTAVTMLATGNLNDTGVTSSHCYQAGGDPFVSASDVLVFCNSPAAIALSDSQDGMSGRDAEPTVNNNADGTLGFSHTKIANNGSTLSAAALLGTGSENWACTKDNTTGLLWEVKTSVGTLRDVSKTYTNFDDPAKAQRGGRAPTQQEIDSATNSIGYRNSVNAIGLCGFSDWRLPTLEELQSLVNYGKTGSISWIDFDWFSFPVVGDEYWSSSSSGKLTPELASRIGLGFSSTASRNSLLPVRLVRGIQ
jgi:pimeloyl-ACP methyl ester carboxylesterase